MAGQIHTLLFTSSDDFVSVFDQIDSDETSHRVFISRMPQRRLIERLDITDIECYWLTDREGDGMIPPSYNALLDLISNRLSNHKGTIFIEGLEWLSSLHGFDSLLSFTRTLSDSIHRTHWNVYLSVDENSFSSIELNQLTREAAILTLDFVEELDFIEEQSNDFLGVQKSENLEIELHEDGSPKLLLLTRLPRNGFSKSLLQRRVLQWRRMGLDVSEVESALYSSNTDSMFQAYNIIEEKVRRAVQLDNWVSENVSDSQERSVAQFRIRQLTGLDQLERRYFLD
ncbi:DUF835 domain-containing protein [Candidatus Poseidoniales archaeon]|nr:DUF835 domain-containing protein [Candidatus Poseidoniales archaeon]|tara:strand:- start:6689 stop:7543 length:855 start_codon:yes stop_codon:yes gene_type:complete